MEHNFIASYPQKIIRVHRRIIILFSDLRVYTCFPRNDLDLREKSLGYFCLFSSRLVFMWEGNPFPIHIILHGIRYTSEPYHFLYCLWGRLLNRLRSHRESFLGKQSFQFLIAGIKTEFTANDFQLLSSIAGGAHVGSFLRDWND